MSNINETPGEIALRAQLAEAQRQITEMRQLFTNKGFYEHWFESLKFFQLKSGNGAMECYEQSEALHEKYFGIRKFSSYESFCKARRKFL